MKCVDLYKHVTFHISGKFRFKVHVSRLVTTCDVPHQWEVPFQSPRVATCISTWCPTSKGSSVFKVHVMPHITAMGTSEVCLKLVIGRRRTLYSLFSSTTTLLSPVIHSVFTVVSSIVKYQLYLASYPWIQWHKSCTSGTFKDVVYIPPRCAQWVCFLLFVPLTYITHCLVCLGWISDYVKWWNMCRFLVKSCW